MQVQPVPFAKISQDLVDDLLVLFLRAAEMMEAVFFRQKNASKIGGIKVGIIWSPPAQGFALEDMGQTIARLVPPGHGCGRQRHVQRRQA